MGVRLYSQDFLRPMAMKCNYLFSKIESRIILQEQMETVEAEDDMDSEIQIFMLAFSGQS
jgi:hypothetical protein